jgi:molecular chaperone GrpE
MQENNFKGFLEEIKIDNLPEKITVFDSEDSKELDLEDIMNQYADFKWKEKYLRLAADFENSKKRLQKEKLDLTEKVKMSVVSDLLELHNDFSIAYKMIQSDKSKEDISIFIKKLDSFLLRQNITEVETDQYDDEKHEVIHVIEKNLDYPIIREVISKGYRIGDKIVKHPKVVLER